MTLTLTAFCLLVAGLSFVTMALVYVLGYHTGYAVGVKDTFKRVAELDPEEEEKS